MTEQHDDQTELLREMVKWLRFSGMKQVKDTLHSILNTDEKKLAFHLSDGKNTSTIISTSTGINQPAVSELWKTWLALGLGEAISASGGSRFKKSFDLKMFGISTPEIKQKLSKSQESSVSTTEEITHEQ